LQAQESDMDEQQRKKGIGQLTDMLAHWEEKDSEFRAYVSWKSDTFKMIGAGNTSGIFAIAVFLTTGTRTTGVLIAAKLCLLIYAVGFGAFFCAYRLLYRTAAHIEDGLIAQRRGLDSDQSIVIALDKSKKMALPILISAGCFLVASLIAVIGLLFS
jgi:hypothetical protein